MKIIKSLYFWILLAFISGSVFGMCYPNMAMLMEPLGTGFVKLVKIFITPIVFLCVATGIAQTRSLGKLGRIGIKAFVYFELISTLALAIGWMAASIIKPGASIHANVNLLEVKAIQHLVANAEKITFVEFFLKTIPTSIVEPFIKGDMLQVLLLAILFGVSLLLIGEHHAKKMLVPMETLTQCFFQTIKLIMYMAPIGVFGAMSFCIAKFGGSLLIPLFGLVATFYITGLIFIFVVLGLIAKLSGFAIFSFLKYIASELFLVLGTASSEAALPQILKKLEKLGCQRETVGVVVPMGFSFNLDGTNIYVTLAALFIAQALGIQLSFTQELTLFATAMLTSKGAAGVTGAGLITLAATLAVVPSIPAVGIVLILGIDRFMSEARSLINYIGNGVASLVISLWEKELTASDLKQAMQKNADEPENHNLLPLQVQE